MPSFSFPSSFSRGSLTRSSTASTLVNETGIELCKLENLSSHSDEALPSTHAGVLGLCKTCQTPLPPLPTVTTSHTQSPTEGINLPLKNTTLPTTSHITSHLSTLSTPPKIVGLLSSEKSGSRIYAESTAKKCLGKFEYILLDIVKECEVLDEREKFDLVVQKIEGLNGDEGVTGLIVYFPIFGDARDDAIRAMVDPRIDLEGINPASLARSYLSAPPLLGEECEEGLIYPCTPLAVVRILQDTTGVYDLTAMRGRRLEGKVITVVNRSETVGRPLAAMLANDGATVFSIDITGTQIYQKHSPSSTICVRQTDTPSEVYYGLSDVVISAVPSDSFKIPTRAVKQGAICINVAGQNNFEEDVKSRAGGFALRVGAVTTLMLQVNALVLHGSGMLAS